MSAPGSRTGRIGIGPHFAFLQQSESLPSQLIKGPRSRKAQPPLSCCRASSSVASCRATPFSKTWPPVSESHQRTAAFTCRLTSASGEAFFNVRAVIGDCPGARGPKNTGRDTCKRRSPKIRISYLPRNQVHLKPPPSAGCRTGLDLFPPTCFQTPAGFPSAPVYANTRHALPDECVENSFHAA